MEHFRINKLAKPDGVVVKSKDVLASSPRQAVDEARRDPDCPVCDVWHAGRKIGSVT